MPTRTSEIFIVLLTLFFVLHTFAWPQSPLAAKAKKCRKSGLLCTTCSTLVACIESGNGTFSSEPVQTCGTQSKCVGTECVTNTTDPFCSGLADLNFVCRKVGIYPHPFYCDQFVMCVNTGSSSGITPYINQCLEGFKYNIASSLCDIRLEDEECPEGVYPVPICNSTGQSEALPEKPTIYYICEIISSKFLYPVLNICPGGQTYHNYQCQENATII